MFEYSRTELATIDQRLDPTLAWAKTRYADAHQLALDSTRLLSCAKERLDEYKSKGFFKRVWYKLSGKTADIQRANQADLLEAQKIGWRYLELLNERDLLQAQSIIAVRNNLLTLATSEEQTRKQVARLAEKVYDRFIRLEERVDRLEAAQQIHSWLLTIEARDYDERFPPHLRMLRVVNDFFALKPDSWSMTELGYLQKAIKDVGLEWRRDLTLEEFVNELIGEIEATSFQVFEGLLLQGDRGRSQADFVLENIAVPSYAALFEIANSYSASSATIDVLQARLSICRRDAIEEVLKAFMGKQGIDLSVRMQLRWLAIELLDSMQLARAMENAGSPADSSLGTQGELEGKTPAVSRRLYPGPYRIPAEAAGFGIVRMDFEAVSKTLQTLSRKLAQLPGRSQATGGSRAAQHGILADIIETARAGCGLAHEGLASPDPGTKFSEAHEALEAADVFVMLELRQTPPESAVLEPMFMAFYELRLARVRVCICQGQLAAAQQALAALSECGNELVSRCMDSAFDDRRQGAFNSKYELINRILGAVKTLETFESELASLEAISGGRD